LVIQSCWINASPMVAAQKSGAGLIVLCCKQTPIGNLHFMNIPPLIEKLMAIMQWCSKCCIKIRWNGTPKAALKPWQEEIFDQPSMLNPERGRGRERERESISEALMSLSILQELHCCLNAYRRE